MNDQRDDEDAVDRRRGSEGDAVGVTEEVAEDLKKRRLGVRNKNPE